MKKTLVTVALAAAAAVSAFAGTPSQMQTLPETYTLGAATNVGIFTSQNNTNDQQFAVSVAFTWSELNSLLGGTTGPQSVIRFSRGEYGRDIAFQTSTDNSSGTPLTVLSVGARNGDAYDVGSNQNLASYVSNDVLVLTLVMHNAGNHVYAYNAATGTVTEVAKGTLAPSQWSSGNGAYNTVTVYGFEDAEHVAQTAVVGAYMYNTGFTNTESITAISKAAYMAAIPEPATATLSLLALAGLAARRRRK